MKFFTFAVFASVMVASSQVMAGSADAGCALAGGVVRGDSSARSTAGQVYQGARMSSDGYGLQDCMMNEVAPYAADRAINYATGSSDEEPSQIGNNARRIGSAAMYGGKEAAGAAAADVGVNMILDAFFGK